MHTSKFKEYSIVKLNTKDLKFMIKKVLNIRIFDMFNKNKLVVIMPVNPKMLENKTVSVLNFK